MTKTRSSTHQGNGITQTTTASGSNNKSHNSKKSGKGQQDTTNGKVKLRQTNSSASVKNGASTESRGGKNKAGGLNGNHSSSHETELQMLKRIRDEERHEREAIVLWKRPITTLHYFTVELCLDVHDYAVKLWAYKKTVCFALAFLISSVIAYHSPGPHQSIVVDIEKQVLWCLYWLGLGVLSSVGLGTGLHTFLLYLGPHIAAVTLAAYECGSLDFPSPPYPDSIICPPSSSEASESAGIIPAAVTLWSIMAKVRLEAMMWGAGTALGELPPYFMARAARLSTLGGGGGGRGRRGSRRRSSLELSDDVEKLAEFEALQQKQKHPEQMTLMDRLKLGVERLVERVGFFGILACASIPNPLFDLAGITCGHFLVPFWTFFGATLIGKAIIKTHLQQLTVIVAFNENLVNKLVTSLATVPVIGARLQEPLEQLLRTQKAKLHSQDGTVDPSDAQGGSLLASLFEKLVLVMVVYFVLSIVNSLAQNYHQRLCSQKHMLAGATPPPSTSTQQRRSGAGGKQPNKQRQA